MFYLTLQLQVFGSHVAFCGAMLLHHTSVRITPHRQSHLGSTGQKRAGSNKCSGDVITTEFKPAQTVLLAWGGGGQIILILVVCNYFFENVK